MDQFGTRKVVPVSRSHASGEDSRTAAQAFVARATSLVASVAGVTSRRPPQAKERSVELDLWSTREGWTELASIAAASGFAPLRALRDGDHRFMIGHSGHSWVKLDAKLIDPTPIRTLGNVVWAARRRRGPVIAVVGPDGAGKSTVIDIVARHAPFAATSEYLGRRSAPASTGSGTSKTAPPAWREVAGAAWWVVRSYVRLLRVHIRARKGVLVLCDRHPIEAGFLGGSQNGMARWMKRTASVHLFPRPDRLVLLTADGQLLFARKREHDPEKLDLMTERFRAMIELMGGDEIDAARPIDDVLSLVERIVYDRVAARQL